MAVREKRGNPATSDPGKKGRKRIFTEGGERSLPRKRKVTFWKKRS